MEWMKVIGDSIQYIEDHISDELFVDDIAKHIGISSFYYQKGFQCCVASRLLNTFVTVVLY